MKCGARGSSVGKHVYEVRPRTDKRGVDLISDVLGFGRLWYAGPNAVGNAVDYAKFYFTAHGVLYFARVEVGDLSK
jgi:hypothetical protein